MLLLLLGLGCATHVLSVTVLSPGHYVIIDDDELAHDCYSQVNGDWRPTCVEVDYRRAPRPEDPALEVTPVDVDQADTGR